MPELRGTPEPFRNPQGDQVGEIVVPQDDPDETQEGLERLDLRDALKQIAYPTNWPGSQTARPLTLEHWMQSVAANALTNAGTYNYERKAKP